MPVPFPLRYSVVLRRTSGACARIAPPPRPVLQSTAPELERDIDASSPEHMLLSSLGLSMLTTVEVLATRDGTEILAWDAKVTGTVDRTPDGLMFTSIVVELDIALAGDTSRFEVVLEEARQSNLVLNSMRVPVVIETQLRAPDERFRPLPGERFSRVRPPAARDAVRELASQHRAG